MEYYIANLSSPPQNENVGKRDLCIFKGESALDLLLDNEAMRGCKLKFLETVTFDHAASKPKFLYYLSKDGKMLCKNMGKGGTEGVLSLFVPETRKSGKKSSSDV